MGSKKKRQESESSSSSDSSSESSESSPEKPSKRKTKKSRRDAESDPDGENKSAPTKAKIKPKTRELTEDSNKEDVRQGNSHKEESRYRRRSSPPEDNRERKSRDDRRVKEDERRHDDRRNRHEEYNRERRPDYRTRDRRDDRNRDNRNRREDDRNYRNRNRDRNRRRSRSKSFDHANAKWGKDQDNKTSNKKDNKEKQKPNFGLSGKLTEETNTYRGVVIKYSEPPEARKPKRRWRLYPFKGEKALQTLYIHRESAYLIGRDRKVVDLPIDHPSCSKQHAVLQYRLVPFTRDDGSAGKRVRPYLIDLNSANGTFINNKKIEASKYIELLEKDVIKFGFSSREYVLLHENSKDEAQDDDVKQEDEPVEVKAEQE